MQDSKFKDNILLFIIVFILSLLLIHSNSIIRNININFVLPNIVIICGGLFLLFSLWIILNTLWLEIKKTKTNVYTILFISSIITSCLLLYEYRIIIIEAIALTLLLITIIFVLNGIFNIKHLSINKDVLSNILQVHYFIIMVLIILLKNCPSYTIVFVTVFLLLFRFISQICYSEKLIVFIIFIFVILTISITIAKLFTEYIIDIFIYVFNVAINSFDLKNINKLIDGIDPNVFIIYIGMGMYWLVPVRVVRYSFKIICNEMDYNNIESSLIKFNKLISVSILILSFVLVSSYKFPDIEKENVYVVLNSISFLSYIILLSDYIEN